MTIENFKTHYLSNLSSLQLMSDTNYRSSRSSVTKQGKHSIFFSCGAENGNFSPVVDSILGLDPYPGSRRDPDLTCQDPAG